MYILGIHNSGWTTSAALFKDSHLIAACPEERLNRQKQSRVFPIRAIEFCLQEAGITSEALDYVAIGWNPGVNVAARYRGGFSERLRFAGEWLYSVPNHLFGRLLDTRIDHTQQVFTLPSSHLHIEHLDHHTAHAATAYYLSPFEQSAIFTTDGYGEQTCTAWKFGQGNRITTYQEMVFPQSIGCFYSTITEFLGYEPDGDEWKVMGMAAYGEPERYRKAFKKLYRLQREGHYEFDLSYFNHFNFDTRHMYSDKMRELFGEPRSPQEELKQQHYDLAAAAQQVLEEIIFHALCDLYKKSGCRNLCLSGGTIMNSVCNGKILQNTPFDKVYIPFSPDDTGNSIGAALLAYFNLLDHPKRDVDLGHPFIGPGFCNADIHQVLEKYKIPFRRSDAVADETAHLIAEGKVVGWFQGRMEFGQRALGNRSILADPRDECMKDKVNAAVKYREAFRPFAPSILEEKTHEFFAVEPQTSVPFMEQVHPIREAKRPLIPAVTHHDGSGRLQTVSRTFNPRYYELIQAFDRLTGIPIILNTSFNVKGEPIVCTPADAIRTFFTSGLDTLVMGDFIVHKGCEETSERR